MHDGERLNAGSHLLGLLLALVGVPALVAHASESGELRRIAVACIFGIAILALYAASTLFHCTRGRSKALWAKADHCAIYLLIAGTYTPFALLTLSGWTGWGLLLMEWAMALFGMGRELRGHADAPPAVGLYIVMGWAGLLAGASLVEGLRDAGWIWLLLGALSYTVGVVFYALDGRVKHAHGIWHLFVLGGSSSHFFTVWQFVI